ncbi:MAG: hypothetical protein V4619_11610 [Bacteroidota bacterium]
MAVTLSSTQSNQKSSQKRGFFAAHGLCPAGQIKTTGPGSFAAYCRAKAGASGKITNAPLPALKAISFYLPSPEAFFSDVLVMRSWI